MFYQQDWVMKQIQMLVRFIARAVFGRQTDEFTELIEKSASGADLLQKELITLISMGEICKAENHLYDSMDKGNKYHLAVAVDFYNRINLFSDEELEKASFSRDEIKDGLRTVTEMYGIDGAEEFLS